MISLRAVTLSANAWTDAGHAVNQVYDILYMMGHDDIPVGVGGDGGISDNGTIFPNVSGYLPLIEQEYSPILVIQVALSLLFIHIRVWMVLLLVS